MQMACSGGGEAYVIKVGVVALGQIWHNTWRTYKVAAQKQGGLHDSAFNI